MTRSDAAVTRAGTTTWTAAAWLEALLAHPSVSGSEAPLVAFLAEQLETRGYTPVVDGRNVWAVAGRGPHALLFASHLDTVPVVPGWTRPPLAPTREGDRLYGLGANDAKASCAAMLAVFCAILPDDPARRVVLALTCDEETGGEGMERLVTALPPVAAGVVGEPTALRVCTAQRGLVRAECLARGRAAHASRPWEGENAAEKAARDILRLAALPPAEPDPVLGRATSVATLVEGGTRANVVPGECRFTLDGRTTLAFDNDALIAALEQSLESELTVRSARFQPVAVSPEEPVVRAALRAAGGTPQAFGGLSDLFWLVRAGIPAVVLGPGEPKRSHAPDEFATDGELERGTRVYEALLDAFTGVAAA